MVPTDVVIIIYLDPVFLSIDSHGRSSDVEFIIDIKGISNCCDIVEFHCDPSVSLALLPLFLAIYIESSFYH